MPRVRIHCQTEILSRDDDFHARVAKSTEEACKLLQDGFEYVTGEHSDGGKIFRNEIKIPYLQ